MDSLKPLLFVAMPFGKKRDRTGLRDIDFDQVYNVAIKPIEDDAELGLEVIRADEERSGGIIHVPMFERLLLSEIVIADVTIPNSNVFYELGIRHCAMPRSTILIYAKDHQLPFDISMIRAIPYQLEDGILTKENAKNLNSQIRERLLLAKKDFETSDSPLFELIPEFPGIKLSHTVTKSFRDRVKHIDKVRNMLDKARKIQDIKLAIEKIEEIENSMGNFNVVNSELIVDLLLSYRDVKAYDKMLSVIGKIPEDSPTAKSVVVREQQAFALNRKNNFESRIEAAYILIELINENGTSPETCGLLGRVYKDLYEECKQKGELERAAGYLDEAIKAYLSGFESDLRNYYPGINAATLMFVKGDEESINTLRAILPAVSFALVRRGGINTKDYWELTTFLEVTILGEDWDNANRAITRFLTFNVPSWMYESTLRNLQMIQDTLIERKLPNAELEKILILLRKTIFKDKTNQINQ